MKLRVDPWAADYEGALQLPLDAVEEEAPAEVDPTVEQTLWQALTPREIPKRPVTFVDGVRRVELRIVAEIDDRLLYGLFGTFAVGAVEVGHGEAKITTRKVCRVVVVGGGACLDPIKVIAADGAISLHFEGHATGDNTALAPLQELQNLMRTAEAALAQGLAATPEIFVFVDGPLTYFAPTKSWIVGYVKRLYRAYLPASHSSLLSTVAVGQRTPIFLIRDPARERYSWYLRLAAPHPVAHQFAGLVRLELSTATGLEAARLAADLSARSLPELSSTPERDPRAPQNLVPIGALERDLRHHLGDPVWVRRLLMRNLSLEGGNSS